ncbi:MAG: SUMF1/EgtB/PvdO family nonheme iron enzyme [Candidatus Sumerlaeota bacterium]|nr:SUMF1/EgtB/PvdO family nonheme iron enzyme [Candidatus Sumerlaeota bacterium]
MEPDVEIHLSESHLQAVEEFRQRHHTGVLTFLFTDMVGSTALKQRLGDASAVALIERYHALVRQNLALFPEAEEISAAGDSFFIVFIRPSDSVRYALTLQGAIRAFAREVKYPILDRVGIHMGEAFMEKVEGDERKQNFLGIQVDTAARVRSLAQGGQILLSRSVFDNARTILKGEMLAGLAPLLWVSHGLYSVKGVEEPLEICEVGEGNDLRCFHKPEGNEKAKPIELRDETPGWRPAVDAALPGANWIMEARLGEGGFGEVWLAQDRTLESRKTVFKFCTKKSRIRSLKRELDIYNRLAGESGKVPPGIVEILCAHDSEPPYYIQMAWVSGGDLRQWICGPGKDAPLKIKRDIAIQMAQALDRVHHAGFIHRDIKPSNFLVEPNEDANCAPTLRLCDFGVGQEALHTALGQGVGDIQIAGGGVQYTLHSQTLAQAAGTYFFIAPELVRTGSSPAGKLADRAETSADIYSLGVAFYQLFVGDINAVPGVNLKSLDDPILREATEACLDPDPLSRPTASQIADRLEHYEESHVRAVALAARKRSLSRIKKICAAVAVLLLLAAVFWQYAMRNKSNSEHEGNIEPQNNIEYKNYFETACGLNMQMIGIEGTTQTCDGYWMGATEVTNAQYKAFLVDSGYDGSRDADWDYLKHIKSGDKYASSGDDYPVVYVSWYNAKAFCDWLSKKTGKRYCLPSEAQWEHACRAGSTGDYCFGSDASLLGEYAWCIDNPGTGMKIHVHPVAQKKANQWGLYDMHGNVTEWCKDLVSSSGAGGVVRGGDWSFYPERCRASSRFVAYPGAASDGCGFRICQETEQSARTVDQSAYAQAKAVDSLESYRKYLAGHGDGQFKNEALQAVKAFEARQRVQFDAQIATAKDAISNKNWASAEKAIASATALLPQDPTLAKVWQDYEKANPLSSYTETAAGLNLKMIFVEGNEITSGGYWMGATELTNAQYMAFVKDSGYDGSRDARDYTSIYSKYKYLAHIKGVIDRTSSGDDYPVVYVSWHNAKAFCEWLSKKTGKRYCLPSEAQWEHACLAGSTGDYCFGNYTGSKNPLNEYAWHHQNTNSDPHPVAQKKANQWGFYDMHGNVSEWCEDLYSSSSALRALRGGGVRSLPKDTRASFRERDNPMNMHEIQGFRICRVGLPR